MRRLVTIFLTLVCSLGLSAKDRSQILKVYNWDDYIDPELIGEFETWYKQQTGEDVEVMYQTFESDFITLNTIELGQDDWDVTTISTSHLSKAMRKGLFKKIDFNILEETSTPNWTRLISSYFDEMFQIMAPEKDIRMFDYVIPLSVGTTGMIYNKSYYTADEVNSWTILEDESFEGKILLLGDRDDVFSIAVSAVNADAVAKGETEVSELSGKIWHEDVEKAEKWLKSIRSGIAGWDTNFGYSYLIQERFPILISWNSQAISAMRESEEIGGPEFGYVIPKEGTFTFCDCMVIPKYSANTKAAVYWIDFMCRPENVIRNMAASNMSSPVADSAIFAAMSDEEKYPDGIDVSYMFPDCAGSDDAHVDPTVYIDYGILKRCFFPGDISKNVEEISQMYSRVQSNEPSVPMLVFEALVLIAIIAAVLYRKISHRERMRIYREAKESNLSKIGAGPRN